MKTMAGWHESNANGFTNYVQVGDEVSEDIFDYFLNVLPPIYWTARLMQCSEPNNHVDGKPTYTTFKREGGKIYYAGDCHRGMDTQA